LAVVGGVGIIATAILAIFTIRLAGAADRSAGASIDAVRLQREELEAINRQLELMQKDQELRASEIEQARQQRQADLERAAHAEIILNDLLGTHKEGTEAPIVVTYQEGEPLTAVRLEMSVVNKGPGYALGVEFGVKRGNWTFTMRDDVAAMAPSETHYGAVDIDYAAVYGILGDPRPAFVRWLFYQDSLGRRWELIRPHDAKVATRRELGAGE
jgi:hypothetical protein